jgi:hypothetical protein
MSCLQFIKNGRLYHDKLNGDSDLHIFDTQLTDVYLDKYDELINERVTFHDIVSLTLFKNDDDNRILPNNLKYLYIKSGTLKTLPISDNVASNIEVIFLDFTNFETFPDISRCTKLREITINHSNLTEFLPNYTLPPSLQILNLRYNNITNVDFTLFKTNPKLKINLSYNKLNNETIDNIIMINNTADIKMQHRYKFTLVTSRNYNNIEIRNLMNNTNNNVNYAPEHAIKAGNVLQGNSQTVHLSSVNKSIVTSYKNILKYIKTFKLQINGNYKSVITEINYEFNKFKFASVSSFLNQNQEVLSIHSILKIKYVDLLSTIWTVVKTHEQSENLIERFHSEIQDSIGKCFTGCINRLINVLVGYIDGVIVSISLKEEIQMSIQKLMDKLNKKQLTYRETKDALVKLLNQDYDVDTSDPNNIISDEYKEAWLSALGDYKPHAILCRFYEKVRVNDEDDRLVGYYYIAYDNLIYNSEQNFDEEKNAYGEIIDADKYVAKIFAYEIDKVPYSEKYLNYNLV